MDWYERLLAKLLTPRGKPVPPGNHLTSDAGYSRIGWPDAPLVFRLPLFTSDDDLLGSYVGKADSFTRYVVDGLDVDVDTFLGSYDQQVGNLRVQVLEPGVVASMMLETVSTPDC